MDPSPTTVAKATALRLLAEIEREATAAEAVIVQSRMTWATIDEHELEPWYGELHDHINRLDELIPAFTVQALKVGLQILKEVAEGQKHGPLTDEMVSESSSVIEWGDEDLLKPLRETVEDFLSHTFRNSE
jgi:hypothetical protein